MERPRRRNAKQRYRIHIEYLHSGLHLYVHTQGRKDIYDIFINNNDCRSWRGEGDVYENVPWVQRCKKHSSRISCEMPCINKPILMCTTDINSSE